MASDKKQILSESEIDMLQELLNISFGRAAAELAEIIDIFLRIQNPRVICLEGGQLPDTIKKSIPDFNFSSLVEQHFHGGLQGTALLVFPQGSDQELLSYFQNFDSRVMDQDSLFELEKEVLMEIGNILMGACLGNLFKLLKYPVRFFPPRLSTGSYLDDVFNTEILPANQKVLAMKTGFQFEDRNITGELYIFIHKDGVEDLRTALKTFWETYDVQ